MPPPTTYIEYSIYSKIVDDKGKTRTDEKYLKAVKDDEGNVKGKYYEKQKDGNKKPKVIQKDLNKKNFGKYVGGKKRR